ncbi:unnamed protein product [Rotaria magnacalcarata]|uniref:VWFA domain-containing protein n=1 Tax=Rotaria magnacalcarata TaxID=392030 RepID=A0A816LG57_9BILA|nr:unnamed protein product [Rotaria magnacalcarata]
MDTHINTHTLHPTPCLFGLVGASRFEQAVHFLIKVFEKQKTWPQHQVSLVTFDNDPKIIVPFSTVSGVHEEKLKLLRPVGKETALFDAINSCLDTFKNLNEINGGHISPQNLYILSDGKRTAGATASNSEIDTSFLNDHTKRLKIIAHIIHIGNTNIPETRDLCEQLGYNYINVYGDNASENANSFLSSIAMRAKAVLATPCVTLTSGAVEKALKRWQEMETTIESLFSAHDGEIDIQRSETEPSPRNRQSNDRRIAIGNEQM